MSILVIGPNDGEQSGGGPIRCRIIEDGTHTEHRVGIIEASVPPSPGGPPQHLHRDHDEVFIVTEGMLRFTTGADSVDVEARSCVTVPAGTPHTPFPIHSANQQSSFAHLLLTCMSSISVT